MRVNLRRAALLVAVAIIVAVVALLLFRPPVAAPEAQTDGTDAPNDVGPPPPAAVGPARWTSVEWQELAEPFGEDVPVSRIGGIVNGGGLLVGWGRASTPERNQFNEMGAVVVSRDGITWQGVLVDHGVGPADTSDIEGVAFGPNGWLAYGSVCCDSQSRAMWLSADGTEWTRIPIEGELDPGTTLFSSIVGVASGWVAVGQNDTSPGFWWSTDGSTWEVAEGEFGDPASFLPPDVAITSDGLIAIATLDGPDGTHDGGIWKSTDGRAWTRVGADAATLVGEGEVELFAAYGHAGGILVTGQQGTTEDRVQCESITAGMVASVEAVPPTAISCGWGTEHHWLSVDGEAWELVDPRAAIGLRPIEFRLVAAGGPGLVVLGESSAPASPDTTLFTTRDGRAWAALKPPPALSAGTAMALVVDGSQLLAVVETIDRSSSKSRIWLGTAD